MCATFARAERSQNATTRDCTSRKRIRLQTRKRTDLGQVGHDAGGVSLHLGDGGAETLDGGNLLLERSQENFQRFNFGQGGGAHAADAVLFAGLDVVELAARRGVRSMTIVALA